MHNLAIRKCTSPPLLAPRLKIFKLKFTTPPGIEPWTCWTRGRHATIWASAASYGLLFMFLSSLDRQLSIYTKGWRDILYLHKQKIPAPSSGGPWFDPGADQSNYGVSGVSHSHRGEFQIGISFPNSLDVSVRCPKCLWCLEKGGLALNWLLATESFYCPSVCMSFFIQKISLLLRALDLIKKKWLHK